MVWSKEEMIATHSSKQNMRSLATDSDHSSRRHEEMAAQVSSMTREQIHKDNKIELYFGLCYLEKTLWFRTYLMENSKRVGIIILHSMLTY